MEYGCKDICCSYGCSLDIAEIDRIMAYKDELQQRLGIDASKWFSTESVADVDYPSKYMRRANVYNGCCVFRNRSGRGCLLHSMALEKGIDPHLIKPMVCFLFPVTWDKGCLLAADFLDELPCCGQGEPLPDAVVNEIRYYLGDDVAAEIESLRNQR
jgi:Fe-S-cluster containining protein